MSPIGKILLTIWITATTVFGFSAVYIVSQADRINAPGELGEIFAATGFIVFIALTVISAIVLILGRKN